MNETTLLHDFGPDAPPADPAVLAAARAALLTHIADSDTSHADPLQRRRRVPAKRHGRRLAVSGGIAAVTVGGLTAALVALGGHAGVNADARAVLVKAAAGAATLPSARPGQFYFQSSQLSSAGGVPCHGAPNGDVELTTSREIEKWIPADRTGDGLVAERGGHKPTYTSKTDARHAVSCPGVLRRNTFTGPPKIIVAPVATPEGVPGTGRFQRYDARSLAQWPHDPAVLYQQIIDAAHGNDVEAFVDATDLLGGGLVLSPNLRVAVLHAIGMIPGISVQHHAAAGNRRHGVALTVRNDQVAYRIVLDPRNGLVLAEQTLLPDHKVILNLTNRYGISQSEHKPPAHLY